MSAFRQALPFCLLLSAALVACSSPSKKVAPPAESTKSVAAAVEQTLTKKVDTPAPAPVATGLTLTCTHDADVRKLNVDAANGGCSLQYTKAGKTSAVATSASGTDHCEKIAQKIRGKLESAGYTCK